MMPVRGITGELAQPNRTRRCVEGTVSYTESPPPSVSVASSGNRGPIATHAASVQTRIAWRADGREDERRRLVNPAPITMRRSADVVPETQVSRGAVASAVLALRGEISPRFASAISQEQRHDAAPQAGRFGLDLEKAQQVGPTPDNY